MPIADIDGDALTVDCLLSASLCAVDIAELSNYIQPAIELIRVHGTVPMEKPNFSGTWIFDRSASTLEISPPDESIFHVDHREPRFHLDRTHQVGGVSDTFSIDLTTDGAQVVFSREQTEIHARMFWEGETLAFLSDLVRGEERGSNTVRYRLTNGGKTFFAEEVVSFGAHRHKNIWVFHRKSGEKP